MKTFKNIGEMKPYYNKETNSYEFYENGELLDIEIKFNLDIMSHIVARDIKARSINVGDITGKYINAWNIIANDIEANDIKANDIEAIDIKANDIEAIDIKADNIKAWNIKFFAVCYACYSFECKSIVGKRKNAKYFCLDSEVKVG